MSYKELKSELIAQLGVTRQAVEGRASRLKAKYGPMTTEEAIGLVAHDQEIDVSRFLESSQVDKIRSLVRQRALLESPEVRRRATQTPVRVVKVVVGGEYTLSDPILPTRVLDDAKQMANIYAELYVFENSVREVISRALARAHGNDWWDACVSPRIQRRAQGRMTDDDRNAWHGRRGDHPIYYIDIGDYVSIITTRWADFADFFPDQSWVVQRIGEIERSRNTVDHHNPLPPADQNRVRGFFGDWCRQIESVKHLLA
jgi:hypothetical protein